MRVVFEIGELVLIGFDPHHRHALGDALERELAVAWASHGSVLPVAGTRERVPATIAIGSRDANEAIARGIATEIVRATASRPGGGS